jgi:endonuclease/exonuclease/phosphatase (EEP) superfamily protein YafD
MQLGRIRQGIELLARDSFLREIEHRRAFGYASTPGPHVVVGDFNTPPESRIYRERWEGWTNAFSVAGFGVGGTRVSGTIHARIDHVLVNDDWKVVAAWMGRDVGSDHRPMVARLRRR